MDGVRGTPRRRRPAWPSQFGDFEVSVPASGSERGWPRGQTETVEYLASDGRIFNSGQNTHPATAAWTFQHIHDVWFAVATQICLWRSPSGIEYISAYPANGKHRTTYATNASTLAVD